MLGLSNQRYTSACFLSCKYSLELMPCSLFVCWFARGPVVPCQNTRKAEATSKSCRPSRLHLASVNQARLIKKRKQKKSNQDFLPVKVMYCKTTYCFMSSDLEVFQESAVCSGTQEKMTPTRLELMHFNGEYNNVKTLVSPHKKKLKYPENQCCHHGVTVVTQSLSSQVAELQYSSPAHSPSHPVMRRVQLSVISPPPERIRWIRFPNHFSAHLMCACIATRGKSRYQSVGGILDSVWPQLKVDSPEVNIFLLCENNFIVFVVVLHHSPASLLSFAASYCSTFDFVCLSSYF